MSPTPFQHPSSHKNASPLAVLILDDERFDRHRLARMCSGLDFPCEVTVAKTLADFAETLEQDMFGLILIDYALPDGDGLQALDMVRLCARNLNAPTLMIAGGNIDNIAERALASGCHTYLSKDALTNALFQDAVRSALGTTLGNVPPTKSTYSRDEVADILAHRSQRSARDIKPMVSRMMRQLRGLRTGTQDEGGVVLEAIEQNCMSLWTFLMELETQNGADALKDLEGHQNTSEAVVAKAALNRKPPSPFGWSRN